MISFFLFLILIFELFFDALIRDHIRPLMREHEPCGHIRSFNSFSIVFDLLCLGRC